jgi:pimeloyl-ACP methyl ester carboxylesterase
VVVPDCGHFIPEEQPEILARLLLDFFGEEA